MHIPTPLTWRPILHRSLVKLRPRSFVVILALSLLQCKVLLRWDWVAGQQSVVGRSVSQESAALVEHPQSLQEQLLRRMEQQPHPLLVRMKLMRLAKRLLAVLSLIAVHRAAAHLMRLYEILGILSLLGISIRLLEVHGIRKYILARTRATSMMNYQTMS